MTTAREAIFALADLDWERVAADAARSMARGMLSKFQPCLPTDAEDRLLAERLLDLPGTLRFLGSVTVNGVRAATGPTGRRLADADAIGPLPIEFAVPAVPGARTTPRNDVQWSTPPRTYAQYVRSCAILRLSVSTLKPRWISRHCASFKSRRRLAPISLTRLLLAILRHWSSC